MTPAFCVALAVYFEARNQPDAAQYLVAATVAQRVEDHRYPDDACSVVWEPDQFEWTNDGKSDVPYEAVAWSKAQAVAARVLASTRYLGLTHFHDKSLTPSWAAAFTFRGQSGRMLFYSNETEYR